MFKEGLDGISEADEGGSDVLLHSHSGAFIVIFFSFLNGWIGSIIRRVHKSLERVPRGFGAWGAELAIFGRHSAWWGMPNA
jgi:hypothetical protein